MILDNRIDTYKLFILTSSLHSNQLMIPYHHHNNSTTPLLFNISHSSSSASNSKRNSLNLFNPNSLKPKSNSFSSSKDSEWLTLEICREYSRGECVRDELTCRYAHPAKHLETQSGRVICCYDYLKGKCHRNKPPCKYLHPPVHLKEQLLQKGKSNLILKNIQFSFLSNQQQQPVTMATRHQSAAALPYSINSMSSGSPGNINQAHKTPVQMPLGNIQGIPYVPPGSYVIIPPGENHNFSNIQYTHMAIETTQIDSNQKFSLQKSSFVNPLQTCGSLSTVPNNGLSPYQSIQQYSFRKGYCIPYQPVLFRNWPMYTYTAMPY